MWFTILKIFEPAKVKKESIFQLASGCDRSDRAKLALVLEKESARASDFTLASTKKDGLTRRHSTTPKLVPFLLFPARQYGVAEL